MVTGCARQERWWARLVTCVWVWMFSLQLSVINDMLKQWGGGVWPFWRNVTLVVQTAFPTNFYTGMLWITHTKQVLITINTATNYSSFIRIFGSIIDYISTLQTHLSQTHSYLIGAFDTNISLYHIIHNYRVHFILYHAWYDTLLKNTV